MTFRAQIQQDVERLLARLGIDVREIAQNLEREGVRGEPKSSGQCAVARYLKAVITTEPGVQSLSVTGDSVHITLCSRWRQPVVVDLSGVLRDFVTAFDLVQFPELVDSPTRVPALA